MKIKQNVKAALKKTPLYVHYRGYNLRKTYSQKFEISLLDSYKHTKVVEYDLGKILDNSTIKNQGVGNFFYSLDRSMIIKNVGQMIDNMPVDYSFVINHELGEDETSRVIRNYIKKVNDPRITENKPVDLETALQAILFWNSLLWQTGHKLVGLGRLDKVLAPYDIPDNAKQLICDFLRTIHCEYEFKSSFMKGDTGQVILLGGLEEDGKYFYNEYTSLFIKCLKEVNLPDPKILLRCSRSMPLELLELALDCVSSGIGSPLFSNDDVIIPNLIDLGYDTKDAYDYGVSACWEPLSIGNSLEQNNLANVEYGKCVNEVIMDSQFPKCAGFDEVLALFKGKLREKCENIKQSLDRIQWERDPLLSFMMGLPKDISEGGAKYNNYGILSVGMSAAVNSLLNINKFVFREKKYTLQQIQDIISSNYKKGVMPFGENDGGFATENQKAIDLTNLIIAETENCFKNYRNRYGGRVKFGLSSPAYITCSENVGATLDGRKAGQPFQTHISRDKGEPITEIMNFESRLHFTGISSNANVLDIMVQSSLIKDNVKKFALYIFGGIKEGIFQLQMNVLSYAQLVDAKAHPENYPDLIVRVWGFSAYFNDLPEEYKDNLIKRAKEMERSA